MQQRALLVGHGVGGEGDDRQRVAALGVFPQADLLGAGAAVHAGHLHIHKHQIERLVLHRLHSRIAIVDGQHLGAQVFEQGLDQQQVGGVVVDAEDLRLALAVDAVHLALRTARLHQLQQQAAQFARAGRLGQQLAMAVGQVRVVQRLLGGRAQHHALAMVALELLVVMAQLLGRQVAKVGPEHGELERQAGLVGGLHALQQLVVGGEQADAEAAVFQLVFQRLARQFVAIDDGCAAAQQRLQR